MYYFKRSSLTILDMKVVIYPCYEVVLEGTFDELMK